MSYSALRGLPGLQTSIREYARCEFYFGDDEISRNAQPPKIIWTIGAGDRTTFERQNAEDGLVSPKSFSADWVHMGARCMGAAMPSTDANEKERRRQEFVASEHLMCCLRWALARSTQDGWLGIGEFDGWQVIWPEGPVDRGVYIDCFFRVKVQLMAPEPLISDPPHEVLTDSVELETP